MAIGFLGDAKKHVLIKTMTIHVPTKVAPCRVARQREGEHSSVLTSCNQNNKLKHFFVTLTTLFDASKSFQLNEIAGPAARLQNDNVLSILANRLM